jgi:hypothetical protein
MKNKQSIRARLRPAGRALAGLVVACVLAFAVTFSAAGSPPDNDNFANAITLTAASTDATTDEATTETGEPGVAAPLQFANVNTSRTVWWKWTAPSTAKYTFAATSLVTDPTIGIFTGSSVNSLAELASSARADHDTGYESRVFLDATSGTDYYVQVGVSPADPSGAFTLKWAALAPGLERRSDRAAAGRAANHDLLHRSHGLVRLHAERQRERGPAARP